MFPFKTPCLCPMFAILLIPVLPAPQITNYAYILSKSISLHLSYALLDFSAR
jgi:hypothetical protein